MLENEEKAENKMVSLPQKSHQWIFFTEQKRILFTSYLQSHWYISCYITDVYTGT